MRLFVALDIDAEIRERLARFADGLRQFAPDARWVKEESLHITLKFIGEWPDPEVDKIKGELAGAAGQAAVIQFKGYGFFPSTKSARVFWVGLEAGPELVALAAAVEEKLQVLGIAKEERKFSPHLTLARSPGGSGSPRRDKREGDRGTFRLLQERLLSLPSPAFGSMIPREFFLYRSQLSPKGSTYSKLANFAIS